MNPEQLRFMLKVFERKVDELEESYKEKNKENFDEDKMRKYVNRKLKKEREGDTKVVATTSHKEAKKAVEQKRA